MAQENDNVEGDNDVEAAQDPARTVAQAAADNRPKRKSAESEPESAPVGKGRATKRRRSADPHARKRTTPAAFVRESAGELRKVVWPTATQLRQYFIVVLVFVLLVILYVSALDLLFGWGLLQLFG